MSTPAQLSRRDLDSLIQRLRKAPEGRHAVREPIPRRAEAGPAPLSLAQQRLWLLEQLQPGSPVYNVPGALRLRGPLAVPALAASLGEILRRHDTLRSRFGVRDGEPVQTAASPAASLPVVDLAGVEDGAAARLEKLEAGRPFDLARGPMMRAVLLRLAADEHLLLLTLHHAAADGWSLEILLRELMDLYAATAAGRASPLPELPIAYSDFAAWQRGRLDGRAREQQLGYWREQLRGVSVLELPTDRPRPPVRAQRGAVAEGLVAPPAVTEALTALARRQGATLFMALLAAFQVLLSRYAGQDDVAVASPTAGRERPELEGLVGFFVNTLVLRGDLSGDPTVAELLERAREVVLAAHQYQDLPFDVLVEELAPERRLDATPLVQVALSFAEAPLASRRAAGLEAIPRAVRNGTAKFDLTLFLTRTEAGLEAELEYDRDLFAAGTAERLLEHFAVLLEGVVADPQRRLSRLPLLSAAERRLLLETWNATAEPLPQDRVHDLVAARAAAAPDAAALVAEGAVVSYGELVRGARELARALRARGVGPETAVAVVMERSPEMIEAQLAVLMAGGAYVALDPASPAERVAFQLADSGAAVVLNRERLRAGLGETAGEPGARERAEPGSENLAYVIYTSGSTGRPKGTELRHAGLANLVAWYLREHAATAADRLSLIAGPGFDASVFEIWPGLCAGASLYVPPAEVMAEPRRLLGWVAARGITLSFMPTPLAEAVLAEPAPEHLALRALLTGGDRLHRAPDPSAPFRFVDHYGPTENTVVTTFSPVAAEAGAGSPSIGRPIANHRVYLLDERLRPVPRGVPGQLFAAGVGLARGYLRRPRLTAERFIPDPFGVDPGSRLYATGDRARYLADGAIGFLGRFDHQVKVRGFRVEPGEIEAALLAHPAVAEAVVVAVTAVARAPARLAAFWVRGERDVAADELRDFLRRRLPDYMVPSTWVALEALPLLATGKVDRAALGRRALKGHGLPSPAGAPRAGLERKLAAIWQEALGVESVSVHDNFFDLGAHSLLLPRVADRIRAELGVDLAVTELFRYPTVAALGERLRPAAAAEPAPAELAAPRLPEIAVVGMAGRFPGAGDPDELWRNLCGGVESISFFADDELLAAGVSEQELAQPGYVRAAGVLDGADLFDAAFFDVPPSEAARLDPQQRLFLECAWEALERAGYGHEGYRGEVGVFAGASFSTYLLHLHSRAAGGSVVSAVQILAANDKDFLATRTSYKLNLKGPSLAVQTACSTSLVAVHVACQSLLAGDCDMALAGGVSVTVPLKSGYLYQEDGILSPDGHCRAFDAAARGTVAGNGVGVVVLKPLERALADGDPVLAVIKGSAVNNDGSVKVGYTAPGVEGQVDVLRKAWRKAGADPATAGYVEAHGTGTRLGDPIEIAALRQAFEAAPAGRCAVGSVKTNLGHLDAAAGVAGMIKTVLALVHRRIPPSLHFSEPNPEIEPAASPFYVNTALAEWPASEGTPRRAGVSSFGIGGTNAHVVLEEAPAIAEEPEAGPSLHLFVLSARTATALDAASVRLAEHLRRHRGLRPADVAYTLQVGRQPFEHRRLAVARDLEEAAERLAAGGRVAGDVTPSLVFLFPGQGAQTIGMGRELYREEPVFRREVDRAAELLEPRLGLDLRRVLFPADAAAGQRLRRTEITQPALFVVEHALARTWMERVGPPEAMIGHSLGEIAAACVAEVFSLEDALALVAERGKLMAALPRGAMVSVPRPESEVTPLLGEELSLAAVNAADRVVVSGPPAAVDGLVRRLRAEGVEFRRLATSHAFHSAMMEPVLAPLGDFLGRLELRAPRIPFVSNLTGAWIEPEAARDPGYWVRHVRETVRFAEGIRLLVEDPAAVFVEAGPGRALSTLARRAARERGAPSPLALCSLPPAEQGGSELEHWLTGVGRLWQAGYAVDWRGFSRGLRRRRVVLPTYPFERRRYWLDAPARADEAALPPPAPRGGDTARAGVEDAVARCWRELLGVQEVHLDDDFFELGGDSLTAVELLSRLRRVFPGEVTLRGFFTAPTVRGLAALLGGDREPPETTAGEPGAAPLSFAQRRLWFLAQLDPASAAYHLPSALRLRGRLDAATLERSLRAVVRRHEALRTTFTGRGGEAVQEIHDDLFPPLAIVDLRCLEPAARRRAGEALAATLARRPFDLGRGPLLRAALLRHARDEHVLVFVMHHIVSDGWSTGVLVRELSTLYASGGDARLPALPIQYAEHARRQREQMAGGVLEEQLAYWRRQLAGVETLRLPTDRPRPPVRAARGARLEAKLPAELARPLGELGHEHGATLFMVLLAAFQALLGRHAGQRDVTVGAPIANRTRDEVRELIGFFVNTLALRGDLAGDPSFRELLARTRRTALDAYAHQEAPFEKVVEELASERDLSRTPLFQAMLVLQNEQAPPRLPGLECELLPLSTGAATFDVHLALTPASGGLEAALEYDRDLFDAATMARFWRHGTILLAGAAADPGLRLSELPLLAAAERYQLVEEWNDTVAGSPPACLHQAFEAQVDRTPEAVAAVFADAALSYRGLDAAANRLARHLAALGVRPEDRVGVSMERSLDLVVALFAVVKAGAAYVPLDPSYPAQRLAFMVDDLAPGRTPVVLTRGGLGAEGARVVDVEAERAAVAARPATRPPAAVGLDHAAYVIYTSGSTGRPKGVVNTHRGISNRLLWMQEAFGLTPEDRVLQKTPFSFDVSVWELFWPPAVGARLVLARPDGHRDPAYLVRTIRGAGVTTLHFVPSMLQAFVEEPGVERLPTLARVIASGEALPPGLVARFHARVDAELHNLYGPTEAAVDVTWWPCAAAPRRVPIGRPIANTRVHVLDRRLRPVPVGVAGELHLAGVQLARGYLGRPALTAERFVPDPFSPGRLYKTGDLTRRWPTGEVEYLGRIDFQVKLRGFRVELGEIEAALAAHPAVQEAAVVASADGTPRLVAYVTGGADAAMLEAHLRSRLPGHMVPSAFVALDALPRTPSGKVDRRALPAPRWETAPYAAPRTPTEEILAAIWSELLGVERVGARDDFFALGGHSLLATRLVSRVRERFGKEVPVRRLFETPTVAGFAPAVEEGGPCAAPPLARRPRDGARPPASFAQERLWLLEQLHPGGAAYHVPAAVRLSGELDVAALAASLREIVRRHESLRTGFEAVDGRPVQAVAPRLEITLPVVDLSGLGSAARADVAARVLAAERRRPFELATPPLLRALVLRTSGRAHVLSLVTHHVVADGWSMGVLLHELTTLFGGGTLPELPLQYVDYAVWQRAWLAGDELERQLAYWRARLAVSPALLELPADRPRPALPSARGATLPFTVPAALAADLDGLARRRGATPFMVLLATFQVVLARHTGRRDLVVGSPIAGRNRREIEGLIGFFVNTLALRADLGGAPTFAELLDRVRETTLGAYAHQDLPFEKLVEELRPERSLDHSPLFQVAFALQNALPATLELPGLDAELLPAAGEVDVKFDLTVTLSESRGALAGLIEYRAGLFDATRVERLARHFLNALSDVAGDPERLSARVALLSPGERHQLQVEESGVATAYPRSRTLPELFAERAADAPDAVALRDAGGVMTYGELARRAGRLARGLRGLGVGPETAVGLCMERTPRMVVAALAVLEAGGLYLPLDPDHPPERLAFMLDDAGAPVVLVDAASRPLLPATTSARLVGIEDPLPEGSGPAAAPESLAYVMYTSGSTGRPKGVAVTHRGVVRLVRGTDYVDLGPGDRVAQAANAAFDAATFEIWGALASGGSVVFVPKDVAVSPPRLAAELRRREVSALFLTTALFNLVAREEASAFATVRHLLVGGEALDPARVREVLAAAPPERLLNAYGPTENTTFTTWYRVVDVPAGAVTVPIGRAVANTRIQLLDRDLAAVPLGVPGQLFIGGDGLARGYLRRPGLTAERFVPDVRGTAGDRLYATGDLVRRAAGGAVEFLGRIDQQVKIRGFRIEPGEVEAVLLELPQVRGAAVVVRDDAPGGGRCLVAYVTPAAGSPSPAELRPLLERRLPEYMVPAAVVVLDALPLNANGKVDRKALPAPRWSAAADGFAAARTPVEELVAAIWAELLGVGRVGVHDDFFALGGHSLLATQALSRVRRSFAVELPLARLFAAPTVAELAAAVEQSRREELPETAPLVARTRGRRAPASFAQERLWLIDRLEPDAATYNVPLAVRLAGPFDAAAARRALAEIGRRHEVLRTTLAADGGEPVQVISPDRELALTVADLAAVPAGRRERLARDLVRAVAVEPFDLERGPLARALLVRLAQGEHVLALTLHHIVADGWSLGVLVRELAALYRAEPLPALPLQYADFAIWQREVLAGDALERRLGFWRRQLAGVPPLELPLDRPRPAKAGRRGGSLPVALPSTALAALARARGATLFMALLAAFGAVLSRLAGEARDFAVGAPIAHRNRRETEDLIGFFVNTLVLRLDFGGRPTFAELLARVREVTLAAYDHQDVPFEKLVAQLVSDRDLSRPPLFQVMLALHNAPLGELRLPGIESTILPLDTGTAKFDLHLALAEGPAGLEGGLDYDRDLFDAATARRLRSHFATFLSAAAARPEDRVEELPLLTAGERHQVVAEWNATEAALTPTCLHHAFEAQVDRTPDAAAVVFEDRILSYRGLDAAANRLARHLIALGVRPEDRVGVHLERSLELVTALFAVVKAGAAYVPLDPSYPRERLAFMADDFAGGLPAPVVLTRGSALALTAARAVDVDGERRALAGRPATRPAAAVGLDHAAYVIYTSGSTGRPKGVVNAHRGISNRLAWMQDVFRLTPEDRVLHKTPFSFDVSVWELFWPLAVGAKLVVARPDGHRDPAYLVRTIRRAAVTTLHFVPSMLQAFVEEPGAESLASLSRVIASGEALSAALAARCEERVGAELHNLYGPTEAAVDVTWWPWMPGSRKVPIGRPIANARVHVLDRRLRPVPVGVAGELHLGGVQLARGYLGRPGLTAERFIPDPLAAGRLYKTGDRTRWLPSGDVEYLGRIDYQVKLRGFRVELGEVEAALAAHPAVREAVVAVREDAGDKSLVAYVTGETDAEALAAQLRARLPGYMVPSAFVVLAALPLLPNGKVDRAALSRLPAPERPGDAVYAAPRTPLEERLAALWSELLDVERVGLHDSFFALGGHSLKATRLTSRLRAELGVEVELRRIFETPTLGAFAAVVAAARDEPRAAPPLARRPRGPRSEPSFAQERLWFLEQLHPGAAVYNVPVAVRLAGPLDLAALAASLSALARRHETLRTRIVEAGGRPLQEVAESLDLAPALVDLSGLGAERRAAAARRLLAAESRRPFDLAALPLVRAVMLRLGGDEHVLHVNMHHVISDGWSSGVLVRDLAAFYRAAAAGTAVPLPSLPVQYADFAFWQRRRLAGEVLERQLDYWRGRLAGLEPLALPTDRPRPPAPRHRGATVPLAPAPELVEALGRLGRRQGTTLFMTLLAAFCVTLARAAGGAREVTVGSPSANRNRREVEELIGFFVNTLALRVDLRGDLTWRELLARVRRVVLEAQGHQDVPFEKVVEALPGERGLAGSPLFQVMFAVQNTPFEAVDLPGLAVEILPPGDEVAAKFDLTVSLAETAAGLRGAIDYDRDLFDATRVERLARHYGNALRALAGDLGARLAELALLGAAERHQLLAEWSGGAAAYPRSSTAADLFAARAAAAPDAVALDFAGGATSYGELDRRANRLAHVLRGLGVGPEVAVGLCLERSPRMVAATLAVVKAGGLYVPLDPEYPRERLAFMITDAGAPVLVVEDALRPMLPQRLPETVSHVISLDPDAARIGSADGPPAAATPQSLAYVMYTSGSTGRPKGVAIPHRGIVRLVRGTDYVDLGPGDRVAQLANTAFDAATFEIWAPLASGAALSFIDRDAALSPPLLAAQIRRRRVSAIFLTTALFNLLAREQAPALAGVRHLLFGGEAVDPARVREVLAAAPPDCRFHGRLLHVYGPTESTTFATWHRVAAVPAGAATVPIGAAVANTRVHVLDRGLGPVPIGVPGQLFIGGDGLARGYLARPRPTAERFVPSICGTVPGERLYATGDLVRHAAAGPLEFLGRIDQQVKIRGFRIEPGEVEAVLRELPAVGEAAVTVREAPAGGRCLVAYVAPAEGAATSAAELRGLLQRRLPQHVVPAAFVVLAALPLTPNGKVDRRALPAPEWAEAASYVAPRTVVEEVLAGIWGELLGLDRVGVHDGFFELGGHSLLATQVVAQVRSTLRVDLPLRRLFEATTIAELAAAVMAHEPRPGQAEKLARLLLRVRRMSADETRMILATEKTAT